MQIHCEDEKQINFPQKEVSLALTLSRSGSPLKSLMMGKDEREKSLGVLNKNRERQRKGDSREARNEGSSGF